MIPERFQGCEAHWRAGRLPLHWRELPLDNAGTAMWCAQMVHRISGFRIVRRTGCAGRFPADKGELTRSAVGAARPCAWLESRI